MALSKISRRAFRWDDPRASCLMLTPFIRMLGLWSRFANTSLQSVEGPTYQMRSSIRPKEQPNEFPTLLQFMKPVIRSSQREDAVFADCWPSIMPLRVQVPKYEAYAPNHNYDSQ